MMGWCRRVDRISWMSGLPRAATICMRERWSPSTSNSNDFTPVEKNGCRSISSHDCGRFFGSFCRIHASRSHTMSRVWSS